MVVTTETVSQQHSYLTEHAVDNEHMAALKEENRRERAVTESVQRDNEILRARVQ